METNIQLKVSDGVNKLPRESRASGMEHVLLPLRRKKGFVMLKPMMASLSVYVSSIKQELVFLVYKTTE